MPQHETHNASTSLSECVVDMKHTLLYQTIFFLSGVVPPTMLLISSCVSCRPGAFACNIKGESLPVTDFLKTVAEVTGADACEITSDAITLPFPDVFDERSLADLLGRPAHVTPLREAIQETVDVFRALKEGGEFWHTNDL